jgi:PAS domain S-box-containing protein
MSEVAIPLLLFCIAAVAVLATGLVAAVVRARAERGRAVRLADEAEALADQLFAATEQHERQRRIIESLADLVVSRDSAGRILQANDAFLRAAGISREGLVGAVFDFPASHEPAPGSPDGHERYSQRLTTGEGERWVVWSVIPVLDHDGRVIERYAVGRDVTERRRAEAASEAKSRFLATVSHEVRTPLNGVLGMTDLLMDTRLAPEQRTYVEAIRTSGVSLLSLIDEILDFSRIEAGRTELADGAFDLHAMAEGVVELLAPKAQHKDIEVALSIAPEAPRELMGDGARVRQILLNLAGNAVKFTERGGVGIVVQCDHRDIIFRVADTGPGIPADRLDAIFDEFEQADGSGVRASEGTGLGLAISRRLAEQMGGGLGVESAVGSGSTFTLRLPLRLALGGGPEAPPDFMLTGRRAIVVSDGPFEGRFLVERLAELGAEAVLVTDADAAGRRMGEGKVDLAIIDCGLGHEAARALGQIAEAAGIIQRIVLLSPYERRGFGPPSGAGYDGYLVKPVRARSLHARLRPEPTAEPSSGDAVSASWEPDSAPRPRLLLAEDNDINALLAIRLLEKLGCDVVHVRDGEAALAALTTQGASGFDGALLDVRMPRLDGRSVAEALRQHEARLGLDRVRLAAVTANAFAEDRRACMAAGFDAFIPKPLDRQALSDFVVSLGDRQVAAA